MINESTKVKSKLSIVFLIVLIFPFIKPAYFNHLEAISMCYKAWSIFSFFIIAALLVKKGKFSKIFIYFILYCLIMFIITILKAKQINTFITTFLPIVALASITELNIKNNYKNLIKALLYILIPYMIINFITIILFPKGLYEIITRNNVSYICWFLGYKNPQIRIILPTILLAIVDSYINKNKLTITTIVYIVIAWITSIMVKSSTAIVGLTIFTILLLIVNKEIIKKIMSKINLVILLIISLLFTYMVIKIDIQNIFAFFIENILHKDLDLTDRVFIWEKAYEAVKNSWLFGYGMQNEDGMFSLLNATHPHNYMLYNLLNGGIIGTLLLLKIWDLSGNSLKKHIRNKSSLYILITLIVFIVMGISESLTDCVLLYPILIMGYNIKYIEKEEGEGKKDA